MIFYATGWPYDISALELNQFPRVTIDETGEQVDSTSPDQLMLIGRLGDAGAVTAHIEGGKQHGTGVQIDITGTAGDLRITNRSAFGGIGDDYLIEGASYEAASLQPMPIPAGHDPLPPGRPAIRRPRTATAVRRLRPRRLHRHPHSTHLHRRPPPPPSVPRRHHINRDPRGQPQPGQHHDRPCLGRLPTPLEPSEGHPE
jgi:hypothetical protein